MTIVCYKFINLYLLILEEILKLMYAKVKIYADILESIIPIQFIFDEFRYLKVFKLDIYIYTFLLIFILLYFLS